MIGAFIIELINYDKRIFRRMERCTRIYRLLPYGTRRTGQPLDTGSPIFAVYHDTGNPDSTAQQNVNYYKTHTYKIGLLRLQHISLLMMRNVLFVFL